MAKKPCVDDYRSPANRWEPPFISPMQRYAQAKNSLEDAQKQQRHGVYGPVTAGEMKDYHCVYEYEHRVDYRGAATITKEDIVYPKEKKE